MRTAKRKEVLERPKSPTRRRLFNNTASVALFNYSKLHTSVSMVISPTVVAAVKKWVQLWDPLFHKDNWSNISRLTGASFESISEV
jgi:hypothetical protein